jgi:hypothetical protein
MNAVQLKITAKVGLPIRLIHTLCPKRPVSFLQSGRPAKPDICALEFYEAAGRKLSTMQSFTVKISVM